MTTDSEMIRTVAELKYDHACGSGELELPDWFLRLNSLKKLDVISDWIEILGGHYEKAKDAWHAELILRLEESISGEE